MNSGGYVLRRRTLPVLGSLLVLILSFSALRSQGDKNSSAERRPVTVADAIRMTQLGDSYYAAGGSSEGRVAQISPDGKQFTVVLKKGDLEHNVVTYSLLLYKTASAFQLPKPKILLSMSSSSNREGIKAVKWLNDNETICFLGEKPGETPQVYRFNTRS